MKKSLLMFGCSLILISLSLALPLTAIILQESQKLANKVAAWNKQCGDKPSYDEACTKKRHALARQLGEFVALVNDELNFLRGPVSPDAPADLIAESNDRRKLMELEVRIALHNIKCLGVGASDPQCGAESTAIETDRAALQLEYEQANKDFDPRAWFSIPVSPGRKKP